MTNTVESINLLGTNKLFVYVHIPLATAVFDVYYICIKLSFMYGAKTHLHEIRENSLSTNRTL